VVETPQPTQALFLVSDLTLSYGTLSLLFFTLWHTQQFIPHIPLLIHNYNLVLRPSAPGLSSAGQPTPFFPQN